MKKSNVIDVLYKKLVEAPDVSTTIKVINGKDGKQGRPGLDGKDGLPGKDGRDGKDGLNGKDGIDGKDGEQGPRGLRGEKGENGLDGKDGKNGFTGNHGKDGVDGLNGRDGRDGKDGEKGDQGLAGKDGLDGLNGLDGKNGTNGIDGKNGTDGKDGLNGKDGKDGKGITSVKFDDKNIIIEFTDKTKSKLKISEVDKPDGSKKLAKELENLKNYVDKRVSTAIFGSGGGGNLSATLTDIVNRVDNMSMLTPANFSEYLWKVKTTNANGTPLNISYKEGLYQKIILTENTTITLIDFPDADYLGRLTLEIINNTNKTITWSNTILWNSGEPPDLLLGSVLIVLMTTTAGNTIFGNVAGQQYA